MARTTQPHRLGWTSVQTLDELNIKLADQLHKADEMIQALYDTQVRVLSDIQQGDWTPTIGGHESTSGQTYTAQAGRYIKHGSVVTAWCFVTLSVKGTITGAVEIHGLPYASEGTLADSPQHHSAAVVPYFAALATNWISLGGYVPNGQQYIAIVGRQSAGATITALATADIGATTSLIACVTYLTSD